MESKTRKNAREAVEYLRSIINTFEKSCFDDDTTKYCNKEKMEKFNEASNALIVAMENLQAERKERKKND